MKCPHCQKEIEEWFTLTAVLPVEARPVVDEAIAELRKEGLDLPSSRRVAMGQVVEMLAASYLASAREEAAAEQELSQTA